MKKHAEYVPLEISGSDLDVLVNQLRDKILNEFWSGETDETKIEKIKSQLTKNIFSVLNSPSGQ